MNNSLKKINVIDFGVSPSTEDDQTKIIQEAFDQLKEQGGTIVFPEGKYHVSSLYVHSNTTVELEDGCEIIGSKEIEDYILFPIPEGMQMHSDMEMILEYYKDRPIKRYRAAMFTAYKEKNISIIGKGTATINGNNCVDLEGEEGYRGPHGFFFSNCENILFKGYTIKDNGNFMHQIDTSNKIRMEGVRCISGSDGVHLHECSNIEILNCTFETGDDCIAGINIRNMHVNNCYLNTSCDVFRIGGNDILVENCNVVGPGKYPHRKTIFVDKNHFLPISEGRHNTICLLIYFASTSHPSNKDSSNIVFNNINVKDVDMFLVYNPNCSDLKTLQNGNDLVDISLNNVFFSGLKSVSNFDNKGHKKLVIHAQNVITNLPLFDKNIDKSQLEIISF